MILINLDHLQSPQIHFSRNTKQSQKLNMVFYMKNLQFHSLIIGFIDSGEFPFGIFHDFRKAFDCVNHSTLLDWLDKLYKYGIRGLSYEQLYMTYALMSLISSMGCHRGQFWILSCFCSMSMILVHICQISTSLLTQTILP